MVKPNIAKMERQIKELTNVETFYDDVREIVGYHKGVFIEDRDIKHLQRVADKRYHDIGGEW